MGQYAIPFGSNEINGRALLTLNEEEMERTLGMKNTRHRITILEKVADLHIALLKITKKYSESSLQEDNGEFGRKQPLKVLKTLAYQPTRKMELMNCRNLRDTLLSSEKE